MKRRNLTTPIVYLIMLGIIVLLVSGFDLSGDKVKKISYSEFIDDVRNGRIQAAEVTELKLVTSTPIYLPWIFSRMTWIRLPPSLPAGKPMT